MEQKFARTQGGLLAMCADAIAGNIKNAATVVLAYNNAAAFTAVRSAAETASADHGAAVTFLRKLTREFNVISKEAREFASLARDILKPKLGRTFNPSWVEAGFERNLVIPSKPGEMEILLKRLADYFAAHPASESVSSGVTAEATTLLQAQFSAARQAMRGQRTEVRKLRQVRRGAFAAIARKLRALARELKEKLDPLDERWLDYGLKMSGIKQKPAAPAKPTAIPFGTNGSVIQWKPVARAEHYRVWKRVQGTNSPMMPVGSPAALEFIFETLPPEALVDVAISAVNNGGESALSEIVVVDTRAGAASKDAAAT